MRVQKLTSAKKMYLKDMPKEPPSAFKVFLQKTTDNLKKMQPELKGFEARKKADELWRDMDVDKKKELEEAAAEKFKEYQEKMKEFKGSANFTKFTKVKMSAAPIEKPTGAPQRALSAIKQYIKDMKGLGKTMEELQKMYNELPEEERAARRQKAAEAEKRYAEELAAYQKSPEYRAYKRQQMMHAKRTNLALAKEKYCVGAPKKPPHAFMLFCSDKRPEVMKENPELRGAPAVMGRLNEMWRSYSLEEKQPWLDKEKANLEEYKKAQEEYEKSDNYQAYLKVLRRFSRPMGKAKGKGKGKAKAKGKSKGTPPPEEPENMPRRPPISPMALFMKENRDKGYSIKTANEAWVQLGAEGQQPYIQQLRDLNGKYEADFKEFQKTLEGKKYLRLKHAHEKRAKEQ